MSKEAVARAIMNLKYGELVDIASDLSGSIAQIDEEGEFNPLNSDHIARLLYGWAESEIEAA